VPAVFCPFPSRIAPHTASVQRPADNVVAWFNDLVSWPKEAAHGDPHNLVLVVHHEARLPLAEAVRHVADRHDQEVKAFITARDRFGPDLRPAARGLEHWIRADVDWSRDSCRYAPDEGR
jgi:hypothetical protein